MPDLSLSQFFGLASCPWWLPPLALLLDLLLADPKRLPHPVQGIGWLAARLEGPARRAGHPLAAGNEALRGELMRAFYKFYSRHVDEGDPGTCILKICWPTPSRT